MAWLILSGVLASSSVFSECQFWESNSLRIYIFKETWTRESIFLANMMMNARPTLKTHWTNKQPHSPNLAGSVNDPGNPCSYVTGKLTKTSAVWDSWPSVPKTGVVFFAGFICELPRRSFQQSLGLHRSTMQGAEQLGGCLPLKQWFPPDKGDCRAKGPSSDLSPRKDTHPSTLKQT